MREHLREKLFSTIRPIAVFCRGVLHSLAHHLGSPFQEGATCRTPSSALDTRARPCVRCVVCWLTFPLARPRPSNSSAAGRPALFGGFAGTMGLCDFPCSFIGGLRPWPSRRVPSHHLRRATSGPPGSRAWRFHACLGSSTAPGRPWARVGAQGHVAFHSL